MIEELEKYIEKLNILMHETGRMENTIFDILILTENFPEPELEDYYLAGTYDQFEVEEWLNKLKSILNGTTSS